MAQNRKPIPKSQRQLSQEQIIPYDAERGNIANTGAMDGTKRAEKLSFKDDNVKPLNIGISDIDEAIDYYIKNVIKPFVMKFLFNDCTSSKTSSNLLGSTSISKIVLISLTDKCCV